MSYKIDPDVFIISTLFSAANMQVIFIETALNIRRFVLRDRKSIRSIIRDTELSRNKIRKYLNDVSPPCYKRKAVPMQHRFTGNEDPLMLYL